MLKTKVKQTQTGEEVQIFKSEDNYHFRSLPKDVKDSLLLAVLKSRLDACLKEINNY